MKQEEIISGNKLLAKFMELNDGWVFCEKDDTQGHGFTKYDISWNWLMPVVEKIEKIGYHISIIGTPTLSHKWAMYKVIIQTATFKENIITKVESDYSNNESKISTIYKGVVEFIKWYNKKYNT